MSSGWSGLILALIIGKRIGWGKTHFAPHSTVLTFIGAALLWVGWYGFNAGSAVAADVISSNAFTTTTLATAIGLASSGPPWSTSSRARRRSSASARVRSPAWSSSRRLADYVTPDGGVIIGVIAGTIPFLTTTYMKPLIGYDDALDVFGVHAIGGTCGALATGFLASDTVNGNLDANLKDLCDWSRGPSPSTSSSSRSSPSRSSLSCIGTAIIAYVLKFTIGLRPTPEQEEAGLDVSDHGEEGYIL